VIQFIKEEYVRERKCHRLRHGRRFGQCPWKTLDELKPGEKAIIVGVRHHPFLRRRLMEIGIREGKEVFMRRDAPLGDPVEISVMGMNLSIRKAEAKFIIIRDVQKIEGSNNEEN